MAPRLPVLSARDVTKLLVARGFVLVGQTGSHLRFKRMGAEDVRLVIVPRHGELRAGTLQSIFRRAGLTRDEVDRLRR